MTVTRSLAYTLVIVIGSPIGCAIGAYCADAFGRRPTIIGASVLSIIFGSIYPFTGTPALMLPVGFLLIVAIYIQVAVLFGVYTPELFPTEVRLRANGICNTLGRAATIVSPFIVIALFQSYKIAGVLEPDDRAVADPDPRGLGVGGRAARPPAGSARRAGGGALRLCPSAGRGKGRRARSVLRRN